MRKMMKRALSMLLAMVLCIGCVTMLATTVLAADADSLDDHLILYSSFDDGTGKDESGNGHDGTVVGNPNFVDGISGKALEIKNQANPGSGSAAGSIYVDYGASNQIIPETEDFTYSVFYRSTGDTPVWSTILSNKDYNGSKNKGFALVGLDDHGHVRVHMSDTKTNHSIYDYVSATTYDGKWHMLTVTLDRDGYMIYYLDGVEVASRNISSDSTTIDAGLSLVLGADGKKQYAINNCELDELRIYDKVLTQAEVQSLYPTVEGEFDVSRNLILYSSFDASNANDESGNGHNGTAVGDVQYVDGVSGKGVHLTGTYFDYGNSSAIIPDTGDFSFSVFFRSSGTTNDSSVLGNKNYYKGANTGFVFVARDDGANANNQRVNVGLNGTAYRMYCGDSGIFNDVWHHLVCTFDRDGSMAFYVDGIQVTAKDISGHKDVSINAGLSLQLGADGMGQYTMGDGYIDELRIYNKALTADEVEGLYNSTASGYMIARAGLNKMLTSVQGTAPNALFPQEDIDEMKAMIQSALDQLDTLSNEQCLSTLANCKAAYETFLLGKKPLASFHWISDVHVPKYNDGYAEGLKNMGGINADTNIGLLITGDNTNSGTVAQIETFYALTKENSPVSAANTAIILGNHDVRIGTWYGTPDDLQNPEVVSKWETVKSLYMQYNAEYMNGSDTVYHAKKIGGYTFIMLNTELDLADAAYISNEQLTWLENTLAAAYAEDPNKPVFIALHQPLYETHYESNRWRTIYMLNEDGTTMSEEESNNKFKAVLEKYPTSIFMSGHIHNGFSNIRGIVKPFGAAVEAPAFKDGGNGYEVQIYSDCVVFRAINYVTGEYAPAYDMTIQIGENNVSQIYQEAQKVLADAGNYDATAIANIQTLSDTLYGLITVSYSAGMDNFYKAAQHTEINATAQSLKAALNDLRGNVSAGDTVTLFAGETLQLTVDGATAWQSGDESIVTVDTNGKLTALKKGATTITITTANGTLTCNVTVTVDASAVADAIYAANTLKTNIVTAETVCGAGVGNLYVSSAAMQALTDAVSAAQTAMAAATTAAEAASAAKAMNDALDVFRAAIKTGVAHDGEFECSTICQYGCGTTVDAVPCVGEVACQDNVCKYCGKAVTPLAHKGEFECSNICQYGCGTAVEPKAHEIEEDGLMCKYGCGKLMGDPTASLVSADGVTTYYTSLEEAVTAATSGSTVTLHRDIGSATEPLQLSGPWFTVNATNVTIDGGNHTVIANSTASGRDNAMIMSRDPSSGFVLKNITIHMTFPESASGETPIINSGGAVTKTIENCKFYTNKMGVYGRNQRGDITMIDTEIHAGYNAYMSYDNGQRSFKVTFTNCKLYSSAAPAIQARIEPQLILNNTVVQGGNGIDITLTQSSDYGTALTIKGNTTFTNGNIAVQCTEGSDTVTFDTTDVPFTGTQIIRESGSNYYFYATLAAAFEAGATKEELYTYSAETAEAIKAEGYFVIANGTRYTIGEPGATLTVDGTTTPYATLQDAIDAANTGNGGTITMLADADYGITGAVEIKHNTTIYGQGKYKITAKITTDFYRPLAGVTFTLKNLTITATTVDGSGNPTVDNISIVWIPNVQATVANVENCTITSTNDVALQAYRNNSGAFNVSNSTIFGGRYAIRYNNSDHALTITNSNIHGGEYGIITASNAAMKATITDSTITSGIHVTGTVKVTLAGNTVVDNTLITTLYPDAGYTGSEYAVKLTTGSNALTVTGNAKIKGIVKVDAGVVNFGNNDTAYTGTPIVRKSGNDYYFYDLNSSLEFQEGDFTYSKATADALVAQYYTVSEASGIYTVTGKIDVSPLVNAINAAKNAKENIVTAEKACMAGAGNRFVSAAQMQALDTAIATAEEKLAAIRSADQVTSAVNELNVVVATFEGAIATGIAHEGEHDCSTICKYDCGTTITAKSAHEGEKDCSTTCKECGTTITAKSVHVGERDCSTTCKWCGTAVTARSAHVGEHDCSTRCKWCGTEITAKSAHVGEHDCSTTCKWCSTTITAKSAHVGEKDCSTTCKECGTTITPKSAHVGEHDCSVTCKECGATITPKSAHVGEHDCSTTCKECGTAIAQKSAHVGEHDCSATCKECGTTITAKSAHEGEFECSEECKYGCGTAMTDAKTCVGVVACVDTTCQWCGEAVTPIAHDMVTDAAKAPTCTETGLTEGSHCSRCDTATIAQQTVAATGHKYDNDTDASCNTCGAERTVENANGNENTANGNENNAQNGNTEAPAKKGLSGGAVAGIVIAAVVVLGGGGFALFWFVIRKKKI